MAVKTTLDNLIAYFATQGCGTAGTDLFANELQEPPLALDLATVLGAYGSSPPEVAFGAAGIWRERPRVQFCARGNPGDVDSARQRIETIWRACGAIAWPLAIDSVQYWGVRVLQSPFWLKVDEKYRHYFVFNAEFYKEPGA